MGLFNKKSDEQKRAEDRIEELCGGFLANDAFTIKLKENNLKESTSNINYKNILKSEIENKTLNYEDIESRLDELMKLDVDALDNKIRRRQQKDTSLFKTQHDINDFMGDKYAEKYYKSALKAKEKNLKKKREEEDKIRKIEEKFNITLTGKIWFKCGIEEIKYSTFTNEARRDYDHAYVIINKDHVEIIKESVWIKSKMGSRKIFYDNIASIDFDARGRLHASSSVIINTKSAEHIQLKFVDEKDYNLLNNAFEDYIKKPQETTIVSQTSNADELLKYAELYEKGLLTKEEFDMKKAELLGNPIVGESEKQIKNENYSLKEEIAEQKGITIEDKPKFCPNCGTLVDIDSNFCISCGNKLNKL